MKKLLIILLIAGVIAVAAPKIWRAITDLTDEKYADIAGIWDLSFTIYEDKYAGQLEFGVTGETGAGSVTFDGEPVGRYQFMEKNRLYFDLKSRDIAIDRLNARFSATIHMADDNISTIDEMNGILKGTRTNSGVTVETSGKWKAARL